MLYLLSMTISAIFPLWHCYYLDQVMLKKKLSVIKFCHWNLNGLAAHDFLKVSLIEFFITTHNFDIICLSETFLHSTVSQHDENIMINDYSLFRGYHPSNSKHGGVCFYFKEHLTLIRRNDLSILQECLVTEIIVDNQKCFFTYLYRSPIKIMRN